MKVFSPLFYYGFIRPVSYLPWRVLYGLSDVLFFVLYYLIGYRKRVVFENLRNAFPEKDDKKIHQIAVKFYAHLCDLIVESIKMFTISRASLQKRMRCVNTTLPEKYFRSGSNLIVAGGHFNNWEMCGAAVPFMFPHHILAIFKPIRNLFFNRLMQRTRGKFGTVLIPMHEVRAYFDQGFSRPTAVFFVIDQSPSNPSRGMWTTFLNQETCFMTGAGRFSIQHHIPVLFGRIEKGKRGHYTIGLEEINTAGMTAEQIMQQLIIRLEQQILSAPEYWLWSHRRWKHKRTTDVLQ